MCCFTSVTQIFCCTTCREVWFYLSKTNKQNTQTIKPIFQKSLRFHKPLNYLCISSIVCNKHLFCLGVSRSESYKCVFCLGFKGLSSKTMCFTYVCSRSESYKYLFYLGFWRYESWKYWFYLGVRRLSSKSTCFAEFLSRSDS